MKLENYKPTSRQVLFREVQETVTKGGILIPEKGFSLKTNSQMFDNEKEHTFNRDGKFIVLAVGKDCSEIQVGEEILLMPGIRPTPIELEDAENLFQVMEQQIIGHGK